MFCLGKTYSFVGHYKSINCYEAIRPKRHLHLFGVDGLAEYKY